MTCQEVKQKIFEKHRLLIHQPRHFDFISSVCGHFQIAHEAGVSDGALAETTTDLLHSILDFIHCHAVLDIIKQRELLGTVFGREFNGTDGDRSDLCVPRTPLFNTPKCGSGDLRGKLCLERQLTLIL